MQNSSILVIGYGNMGRPIVEAAISCAMRPHLMLHKNEEGIEIAESKHLPYDIDEVPDEHFDYILLAVKPQNLTDISDKIKKLLNKNSDSVVISIMAGTTIATIRDYFPKNPIARFMPNLAITVKHSFTTIATDKLNDTMKHNIAEFAESFGDFEFVEDEETLDMMTSVTGSGPAYFAYFMKSMIEAAEKLGIPKNIAKAAIIKTALGTADLMIEKNITPAELIKRVSSKGGVTEAGVNVLDDSDFSAIVEDCIKKTYDKAQELAQIK